jgi:DNA-binding CsgD family transcriptional regulator
MKHRLLLSEEQQKEKEILIYENPQNLKLILNNLSWRILRLIGEKEMYPMEIARKLGIHEQIVYYHIRKLINAKAIVKGKEEEKKGATAKYYKITYPAFGVELPFGGRTRKSLSRSIAENVSKFLDPALYGNIFEGKIVVGSPEPHGPFKASARDGHYAAYLAFYLGQYAKLPDDFIIKLDVDEKLRRRRKITWFWLVVQEQT